MKVFIKSSLLFSLFAVAAGCTGGPAANAPANNSAAQPVAGASSPGTNAAPPVPRSPTANANALTAPSTADKEPAISLDSPTAAYKAAYAIRQKKDVQALKQVMSSEMVAYFTELGRAQKKSLDQVLALLVEQPQAASAETRNQRISGDRAVLEFKDASGKWLPMDFVKEDGSWKMALSKVAPAKKGAQPAPKR